MLPLFTKLVFRVANGEHDLRDGEEAGEVDVAEERLPDGVVGYCELQFSTDYLQVLASHGSSRYIIEKITELHTLGGSFLSIGFLANICIL